MKLVSAPSIVYFFFAAVTASFCLAAPSKDAKAKEAEAILLRQMIDIERDSLQNEIAQRWREKQRTVERREADKDELSAIKETQEKTYNDLERVREERLVREKTVEEAGSTLALKRDEWRALGAAIDDVFGKEADRIIGVFPPDVELRRNELETLRRQFGKKQDAVGAMDGYAQYAETNGQRGNVMTMVKQRVLPDEGKPQLLSIARFGTVFGYGLSEAGEVFFIRQSGRLGAERYRIDKIEFSPLLTALTPSFPQWIASGSPGGTVPTDVLQNEQTKMLVAGRKVTQYRKLYASFKAGGAVMIPLLLLPLWALALIALKMGQFGRKRGRYRRQCSAVASYIDKNDIQGALAYARRESGIVARIAESCLEHRGGERSVAEKSVRELLLSEIPYLSRYLNTLAVIAGAAPLLGLLGTISGMINLFGAVTHYGTGDPKFLAGGISEALITAKTGLAIAIPVLFIHDYLRNKKDRLQADIEKYALRILNKLWL